jgi:hypothetical protein
MDNFNQNQSYGQPNQNQGFGQGGMYQTPGNTNFTQPTGVNAPNYTLYLILSIILIAGICCCNVVSLVLGIISIVYLTQANSFFKMGNMAMYEAKIKVSKILIIVGYALIVLGIILNIVSGAFSTIVSILNS